MFLPKKPEEGRVDRRIGPANRRKTTWLSYGVIAVLIVVIFFLAIRLRKTYANSISLALLEQRVDQLEKKHKADTETDHAVMTQIMQTLYSNISDLEQTKQKVEGSSSTRRPAAVEIWMRNRDLEYQKRLKALEQWRLSLTR